jgi:dolichol-phosphate mannosyltransferase
MTDVRESGLGAVIIVPTYNELENLPLIVPAIREHVRDAHVLIVDDSSPDGTGQRADEMACLLYTSPSPRDES